MDRTDKSVAYLSAAFQRRRRVRAIVTVLHDHGRDFTIMGAASCSPGLGIVATGGAGALHDHGALGDLPSQFAAMDQIVDHRGARDDHARGSTARLRTTMLSN